MLKLHFQRKIIPYALRLSRECFELSLKPSLMAVGIEYPKVNDVSDILIESKNRFQEWFRREMNFLCYSSRVLAKKRELSFYGGEEPLLSP